MSFLLWVDEAKDQAIDLGDPFALFQAFGEMAKQADSDKEWEDLFSVPGFGEQDVERGWLRAVSRQAKKFLDRHGDGLGEHARWILEQLTPDGMRRQLGKGKRTKKGAAP